jgi:glycosyltransferase involved in cell wall biosynthesis
MIIAINTRFLMPQLEGIGWFTHEVVKRWVEWHPEHEFIFIFDRPYDKKFLFDAPNVTAVSTFPPARHPVLFYLWYEWSIPRILKKYKADVFVSPDGFLSLSTKIPTLMVLHDIAWRHFDKHVYWSAMKFYNYYVPKYADFANRIATVSEFSKKDIVKQFGVQANKIDVVYNGSLDKYKPLSDEKKHKIKADYSEGQDYFLYVGSINPRKNVPNLLLAFEEFKKRSKSPMKLLLAGRAMRDDEQEGKIRNASAFKEDIILLGYVDNDLLPKIVASAFSLTYVSLFEGFGIPLVEAMYCNVPCITSNCSSMPEVAGDAGLLADPESVEDICSKMMKLFSEPDLRDLLIEKGKVQRQKFSWDLTASKMWNSLEKTLTTKID